MQKTSLIDWLNKISLLHPKQVELGLRRVKTVAERLDVLQPAPIVITVGGTNGKGSTVAGLECIYQEAGYKTGVFTSPYLYRFNEEVRVNGVDATDDELVDAFEKIDIARNDVPLTVFECATLAALIIFKKSELEVCILEVGLGGRLDAVNMIDAAVSVITSIGIDHVDWLGDTREKIAFEKAGIFRPKRPAVCGDSKPPITLLDHAGQVGALLYCQDRDFYFEKRGSNWNWSSGTTHLNDLPLPTLALQNMSTVLMVIELLQTRLSVSSELIKAGLKKVSLPGRLQVVQGRVTHILDVSHNPDSAAMLAQFLQQNVIAGKTRAVFSMLGDKDILSTLHIMKKCIDEWFIGPLEDARAASIEKLVGAFEQAEITAVQVCPSIQEAHQAAERASTQFVDRIVVFGSFHTVGAIKF